MGLQRVRHHWATEHSCIHTHTHTHTPPRMKNMDFGVRLGLNSWHDLANLKLWQLKSFYFFPLSLQFSSVAQSCPSLCDPMNRSTPGLPVHHQLPEFTQTHVHRVSDAIQPIHPLLSPSPTFNLSQHQGFFKWVSSSHQVAKVLEFQLQHQSFQWIYRTDFL